MTPLRRRLAAVLASAFLGLLALEACLRLLPLKRASALANEVYTAYGNYPGAIYFSEPETGVNFMVPNLRTENFWNGYTWTHATDGLGFRNPPGLTDRALLLLGDSLIYGHGVEEEETVAHRLREDHRRPAYNMARQGDCLYPQYVLLRLYQRELRPRSVVLFVFYNDVHDLVSYRSAGELERVPELGLDDGEYGELRRRVAELGREPRYPLYRQAYRLLSVRLLRALARSLEGDWMARAEAAPPDPLAAAVLDDETFRRASRYYVRVLGDLAPRLRAGGTRFHVVLLDVGEAAGPDGQRAYARLESLLSGAARDLGFAFATTRETFAGCRDCFLPGDGHLSPAGHARLARFVDAAVMGPEG